MFIPLGLEDSRVDRLPWASIAIALVTVAVFLFTWVLPADGQKAEESLRNVLTYWMKHPHLELPEEVASLLPKRIVQSVRQRASGNRTPSYAREAEQSHLDELCRTLLAHRESSVWLKYGLTPARGLKQPGWFTYMFLHYGWLHLLGNLLFFYIAGPFLEDKWGRGFFTIFYLTGGMAAALCQAALDRSSTAFIVGASGAVAACIGAFAYRFALRRVRVLVFIMLWPRTFLIQGWAWSVLWFGGELLSFRVLGSTSGVAFMAHIGGWLFGFGTAALMAIFRIEERFITPRLEERDRVDSEPSRVRRAPRTESGTRRAFRRARVPVLLTVVLVSGAGVFVTFRSDSTGPAAATGALRVDSAPQGGSIYLDGEPTGHLTPYRLPDLELGRSWRVSVRLEGYRAVPAEIEVEISRETKSTEIAFALQEGRTVRIATDPPGAEVFVASGFVGSAPVDLPPMLAGETVQVSIDKEGYMPTAIDLEMSPKTAPTTTVTLVPATTLSIESRPSGAALLVDGKEYGSTPVFALRIPSGRRTRLELRKKGHRLWKKIARGGRLRDTALEIALQPLPLLSLPLSDSERKKVIDLQRRLDRTRRSLSQAQKRLATATARFERLKRTPHGEVADAASALRSVEWIEFEVRELALTRDETEKALDNVRQDVLRRLDE